MEPPDPSTCGIFMPRKSPGPVDKFTVVPCLTDGCAMRLQAEAGPVDSTPWAVAQTGKTAFGSSLVSLRWPPPPYPARVVSVPTHMHTPLRCRAARTDYLVGCLSLQRLQQQRALPEGLESTGVR